MYIIKYLERNNIIIKILVLNFQLVYTCNIM
jgi:hypothetical protein